MNINNISLSIQLPTSNSGYKSCEYFFMHLLTIIINCILYDIEVTLIHIK